MLTIYNKVRLTRRRTINQVMDENGALMFSSESLVECLTFVNDQGQTTVPIQDENWVWFVTLEGKAKAPTPWDIPSEKLLKNSDLK